MHRRWTYPFSTIKPLCLPSKGLYPGTPNENVRFM